MAKNHSYVVTGPIGRYTLSNKKVYQRIRKIDSGDFEDNDLHYVESKSGHKFEDLKKYYENSLENKKSLEDKSKVSLLSITLSTSLITGLLTVVLHQSYDTIEGYKNIIVLSMGIISISHMIVAAVLSLIMLSGKIVIYQMYPSDENLSDIEKCELLAVLTEQNTNMNVVRNNNLYTSYMSIVNSLVWLCGLFIVLSIYAVFSGKGNDVLTSDLDVAIKEMKQNNNVYDQILENFEKISTSQKEDQLKVSQLIMSSKHLIEKAELGIQKIQRINRKTKTLKETNH